MGFVEEADGVSHPDRDSFPIAGVIKKNHRTRGESSYSLCYVNDLSVEGERNTRQKDEKLIAISTFLKT